MKPSYIAIITVLVLGSLAGCATYGPDDTEDTNWDILSAGDAANTSGAVVGRLWLTPNPIVFGMLGDDFWAYETAIHIANVGSEPVRIEKITVNGDPDFDFYSPPEDDGYPNIIDTDADCNGFSAMGFMLSHAVTANDSPTATMTVHTKDPTSPTFSVPIYRDRNYVVEDPYGGFEGTNPVVKPNPIRINRKKAKDGQNIEICMFFQSGDKLQARTTKVETVGEAFAVEELRDNQGGPIAAPGPPDEILPASPSTIVISYMPIQEPNQDGALVIHFDLVPGGHRSLVVPILVR